MKKILFFIPTLGHGGAERVLVNLVNHMDQTKYDITVQTMFDVGIYQDKLAEGIRYIGGHRYYFRGNTLAFQLFSPKRLFRHYVKEKYDVIVSFLEGPSARVIAGCPQDGTKLVSWIHVEQPNEKYICRVFRSMKEATAAYSRFDRIVCVADTVLKNFCSIFPIKVPMQVLYNVVETDVIRNRSHEPVDDLCLSKETVNICSVAKLMAVKGYDRLIRVMKRIKDDGLRAHLYLIGKGEEEHSLKQLTRDCGLEGEVTFVGFKENPYKYVAACDLYVCSSFREGFSTSVTEALIVGTPVVSTDCSGAKELLGEENEYGIVTENTEDALYEGVHKILAEDGLLAEYKNKARERGLKFDRKQTVFAVEKMLDEVVQG